MDTVHAIEESQAGLRKAQAQPPWEVHFLPVSQFPMPEAELAVARSVLAKLTRAAIEQWNLKPEFSIQINQLHLGDGVKRISEHGREWIPQTGLGVWPDRPAPAIWTPEDFTELGVGEKPRELIFQVLRVTTTAAARESAQNVMLGSGTVLQILVPDSNEMFLNRARKFLLAGIADAAYTCFPFYVPLLELKSLANATAGELDLWMCGCSLYIRESVEDNGILIASRQPLGPVLEKLGGRQQSAPEPGWLIPA